MPYCQILGQDGYLHADCANDYCTANAKRDLQGRAVSYPTPGRWLTEVTGDCIHCGGNPTTTNKPPRGVVALLQE